MCVWGGGGVQGEEGSTSGSESDLELTINIFIHSTVTWVQILRKDQKMSLSVIV